MKNLNLNRNSVLIIKTNLVFDQKDKLVYLFNVYGGAKC